MRNRVSPSTHKAVLERLRGWPFAVESATWRDSSELKQSFRSASIVTSERVLFNIKGNDHRLVAAINYKYQILLVKWLGTHKEYDSINVKAVMYDKERYANPTYSN